MQRACSRHQAIGLVPSSFNVTSRDSGLGCWRRGLTRRTHTKAGLPAANAPTKNKGETRRAWINGSQRAHAPRSARVRLTETKESGCAFLRRTRDEYRRLVLRVQVDASLSHAAAETTTLVRNDRRRLFEYGVRCCAAGHEIQVHRSVRFACRVVRVSRVSRFGRSS